MNERARGLVLALIAALVVVVAALGWYGYASGNPPFGQGDDQWSGVFLTNGQAYFGHFSSPPGDYVRLREVYYVLATQLQSQDPSKPASTQLSLQKLGGEIHGPRSDMQIEKQQILFVEELRGDSPLVAAIAQLKTGGGQAPQPQPTAQPAATSAPASTPTASPSRTASPSPSR